MFSTVQIIWFNLIAFIGFALTGRAPNSFMLIISVSFYWIKRKYNQFLAWFPLQIIGKPAILVGLHVYIDANAWSS
jgi:hypothetical protein